MFLFQPLKWILQTKINDVDEDNSPDNAQSKEEVAESGISTEEVREENGNGEEFTPTVDGEYEEGDNTELEGSQYRYPQQQNIVNNGEETEGEIPSSILPFLNEP